jgi:hypothetical protein
MLEFKLVGSGARSEWHAEVPGENLGLVVAGSEDSPEPALVATMNDVVRRWPEVRSAIETFVRALAADARVPLETDADWCFRAGDCGFDGELSYQTIVVADRDAPTRASVTFYTGLPDGYATYRVLLESGQPLSITAFAS